jgi:cobalt-zinc-cadmium efflux system protein
MTHGKHDCAVGHGDAIVSFTSAFAIGVALNLAFVVIEATFGFFAHSLSLIADAGHNLSDVLGLVLAWCAAALSLRAPTERRTYGWKSSSILAALFNAILLLVSVGAIAWEAVRRLHNPPDVAGRTIIWVSAIGIVINSATALMFFSGRKHDINIRGAFMHMAADAAVSLGVVLAGWAILVTGMRWIDPAVSLVIAAVIVWGTWSLLRDSINLALHGVPEGIELPAVRAYLASLPHVTGVHDLHVWPMSTTETALTAHLVRDVDDCDCSLLDKAAKDLRVRFQIQHATLQFETIEHECSLASEETV